MGVDRHQSRSWPVTTAYRLARLRQSMYNRPTIQPSFISNEPIEGSNPNDPAPGDPSPKGGSV
jgi:hypothetical protein